MLRWSFLLLAACAAAPSDPYREAEHALAVGDLPTALSAFDSVPVAHPRYPEARAAALGVERRLRRSHEELLTALALRAEWRDPEAVATLERVLAMWPHMPGIDRLLAATRDRAALLAVRSSRSVSAPSGTVARTVPVGAPSMTASGSESRVSTPDGLARPPATVPPATPAAVADSATAAGSAPDAAVVAAALIEVEQALRSGRLEAGIAQLRLLADKYAGESQVRARLVRVLHQRALLSYGRGALSPAVADWQEVLALDAEHRLARSMLASAQAELAAAPPR